MKIFDWIASRYLAYRLRWAAKEGCINPEDWKDGEAYADGGCYQCKANLVRKFLEDY